MCEAFSGGALNQLAAGGGAGEGRRNGKLTEKCSCFFFVLGVFIASCGVIPSEHGHTRLKKHEQ